MVFSFNFYEVYMVWKNTKYCHINIPYGILVFQNHIKILVQLYTGIEHTVLLPVVATELA